MWVCREDTKVLRRNPPEKGEETGIAMDNMKPSGSCPEKIEVVVVVVVPVWPRRSRKGTPRGPRGALLAEISHQ